MYLYYTSTCIAYGLLVLIWYHTTARLTRDNGTFMYFCEVVYGIYVGT
jgi:hypothetical protein